ncbi:trans-3-hydroxy-L-proline dehydratase [Pseudomonas sp. RIT288]|jgi:trans-L-3-hydroxyproline dehydratase|uniref:trans-3-hydroxy-L-proline dehydratase n=1 Tax=Pseudomonas sp. RIT288 TaxID=1470589 RepID=UPI0004519146|nr:trans-3-hydroxy-L-proline dehydratase [Pseudomonas sp. RIT288]EZP26587.1 4-hydroxyproline epimerase [Pseudomonas sp. RIT288]
MQYERSFATIELHTSGETFRLVTQGLPKVPGATIVERSAWLQSNADHYRRALMLEPRGHKDLYGGFLTEPVSEDADFGIIFLNNMGYSPHCGHGVIALATAAVELGWIERKSPETRVGIDAPCGFIEAFVEWDGTRTGAVRFVNVASFIFERDVTVTTPTFGNVTGDIAYGGATYFYVDGRPHNIAIREKDLSTITQFGYEIKAAINARGPFIHPEIPEFNDVYGVMVYGDPRHEGSTQANCCVYADRAIDRSPTGSGTAGRVAQLYLRGELSASDALINESIIGTVFKGRVLSETKVGSLDAVIPEVSGKAHICGFANWVIDETDPLTYGFLVQ